MAIKNEKKVDWDDLLKKLPKEKIELTFDENKWMDCVRCRNYVRGYCLKNNLWFTAKKTGNKLIVEAYSTTITKTNTGTYKFKTSSPRRRTIA